MTRTEFDEHVYAAAHRGDTAALPALRDRLMDEWGLTDDEAAEVMRHLTPAGFHIFTPLTCIGMALQLFDDIWRGWTTERRRRFVEDNALANAENMSR